MPAVAGIVYRFWGDTAAMTPKLAGEKIREALRGESPRTREGRQARPSRIVETRNCNFNCLIHEFARISTKNVNGSCQWSATSTAACATGDTGDRQPETGYWFSSFEFRGLLFGVYFEGLRGALVQGGG